MPIDYVAYDEAGVRVTGVVDADTEAEAERRLWSDGLLVVELESQEDRRQPTLWHRLRLRLFPAKPQDVITLVRQLETLLRAGVPLHSALAQLRSEGRNPAIKAALEQIVDDIEAGDRLSRAIARHPKVFPMHLVRMIPVAEASGELPRVLTEVVRTMERQARVAGQARSALLTPAISLVVGFGAAFILFTFVLPRLVKLLQEFGGDLPRATRILIGVANFSRDWGWLTIGVVVALAVLVALYVGRTTSGRRFWHRFLLRAPMVGPVVRASAMFEVCSMWALLLQTGVSPVGALRTVVAMIGNIVVRDGFARVEEEVTAGGRLGAAMSRQPVVAPLLADTVSGAEQAGALRMNLEALADYYQEETDRRVQASTGLIEPIAFLIVGGLVGFIAVAVLSGIYSVIPTIGANS